MTSQRVYKVLATGRVGCGCTHFYIDGRRVPFSWYEQLRGKALASGAIQDLRNVCLNGRVRRHATFIIYG